MGGIKFVGICEPLTWETEGDSNLSRNDPMNLNNKLRVAIYNCITGGYDNILSPLIIDPRFNYFCFTDRPENIVYPWKFMPINLPHLNTKDQNRFIKMHPHKFLPDYDITVYIDGSIQIIGDLNSLIYNALNSSEDIFIYEHPQRNCIYTEAAACTHYAHDWIWVIASQMRRYNTEGYPIGNGLFEAMVIIRKNTAQVHSLMSMWWSEYYLGAKRDQLSLPVSAWRLRIPIKSLGESDPRFGNRYFRLVKHLQGRRSILIIMRKHINRTVAYLVSYAKLFGLTSLDDWR